MVYKKCAKVETPELEPESNPTLIQIHATHYATLTENCPKRKYAKMVCAMQTVDASASKDSAYEDDPLVPGTAP